LILSLKRDNAMIRVRRGSLSLSWLHKYIDEKMITWQKGVMETM